MKKPQEIVMTISVGQRGRSNYFNVAAINQCRFELTSTVTAEAVIDGFLQTINDFLEEHKDAFE